MAQVLAPDVYNAYSLISSDAEGLITLTFQALHLPDKAVQIVFEWLPSSGVVTLDGSTVAPGVTAVSVTDIILQRLVWNVAEPDAVKLLDIGYKAYDGNGEAISLLQVYYPTDVVINIVENIVNGGNFKTGEDGAGYDTDAGDFDTAETVVNGYSYDGGDFTTGERVGVSPPPVFGDSLAKDGELNPVEQNGFILLDENLDPVQTSTLPNLQYFTQTVTLPDFSISINYTLEHEIKYVSKYFEGFDYGSVVPNYGYDIDYGSLETGNLEDYDFNSIVDYAEPAQVSSVT